jgi:hypothetical protein
MAVVVAPLLLYSDDLSGNRSKQWNLFDVWCLLLAGLPKKLNHQLRHIHLLCASNTATAVDMMSAVVKDLCTLEKGVEMFDAKSNQNVFVIAPVLAILCDNPRASQILGHMTGGPIMFCRVCKVCTVI